MGLPGKLVDGLRRQPFVGLVLGVVAVLLAVLVLRVAGAGKGAESASGGPTEEITQVRTPEVALENGDKAAASDEEASVSDENVVSYTATDAAVLGYVDEQGVVRAFSDEPLGIGIQLTLNRGASVWVSAENQRQLSDRYLEALKDDLQAYRDGATTFSSVLEEMLDTDQYVAFLGELAACDDEARAHVVHLVVDEGALEEDAEAEVALGPEDEGESDPEEDLEQYGGRPSAGAME